MRAAVVESPAAIRGQHATERGERVSGDTARGDGAELPLLQARVSRAVRPKRGVRLNARFARQAEQIAPECARAHLAGRANGPERGTPRHPARGSSHSMLSRHRPAMLRAALTLLDGLPPFRPPGLGGDGQHHQEPKADDKDVKGSQLEQQKPERRTQKPAESENRTPHCNQPSTVVPQSYHSTASRFEHTIRQQRRSTVSEREFTFCSSNLHLTS